MRVVFAGTPEFAARALVALQVAGHEIMLVLTQPDRPAGRGMGMRESAIKARASVLRLPVLQPLKLGDAGVQERLHTAAPDVMVVAAYGLIRRRRGSELSGKRTEGCRLAAAGLRPFFLGAGRC